MMPRVMRMYDEKHLPGLQFCGGHAMRGSGYNSSYLSGNLAAKLTLMEMKKEAE
jgi:prolycopene isomerase